MMFRFVFLMVMTFTLVACGTNTTTPATIAPTAVAPTMEATEEVTPMMDDMEATMEAMEATSEVTPMMDDMEATMEATEVSDATTNSMVSNYSAPDWSQLDLVNARTGETFKLADFAGKVVYVEPMATWCSNCRSQLRTVNEVFGQVNTDDVIFVALSVENGLANETLAQYADDNGFNWVFAVATPDLLQALITHFNSRTITNPPTTPHFLISPIGTVSSLMTGFHTSDEIIGFLNASRES